MADIAEKAGRFFSHLTGNHQTHVANAYHKVILARVESGKISLPEVRLSAKGVTAGVKLNDDKVPVGFTRIIPREKARFQPNCTVFSRVYITIMDEDGKMLCDNLEKAVDRSVLVKENGQVVDSKYGSLWQED